jgi:hypothetical protein
MNAVELAHKFRSKIAAALVEKQKQSGIAANNTDKRAADVEYCKLAMEREVIPFLSELKHHLIDAQFSFAPQIELNDHRPVGVSFTIGNGAPTSITTAFGNIIVTRVGDSGMPTAFLTSTPQTWNRISPIRGILRVRKLPSWSKW